MSHPDDDAFASYQDKSKLEVIPLDTNTTLRNVAEGNKATVSEFQHGSGSSGASGHPQGNSAEFDSGVSPSNPDLVDTAGVESVIDWNTFNNNTSLNFATQQGVERLVEKLMLEYQVNMKKKFSRHESRYRHNKVCV
jgi:hypothetical protein